MPDRLGVYPARWPTGSRAPVRDYPVATAATWGIGALLFKNVTGTIEEAGADPAAVLGISTGPEPQNLPGHVSGGALGRPATLGKGYFSEVYIADDQTVFSWPVLGTPVAADVGLLRGVVKDVDDVWKIDLAEITATVVRIVALDPLDPTRVFARFDSQSAVTLQG